MLLSDDKQIWFFTCTLCIVSIKKSLALSIARKHFYNIKSVKSVADSWSVTLLKHKVALGQLDLIKPGFDLTDDEIKKFKLWPQGVIPYFIDDFSYDRELRDRIHTFLEILSGTTGLHFRELPSPPEEEKTRWVFFVNRQALLGCSDHTALVMTNEGVQKVVLGYDCMNQEDELAEAVLAILGVPPQHNSPDRDVYVTVETKNIIPDKQFLFKKLQDSEWLFHDLQYDFSSAGHFNFHKHTVDGQATIIPKKPIDIPVGENNGFSITDIVKIRMLYSYISKKNSIVLKAPECHKLFAPGKDFDQFEPGLDNNIKPRKKPNRYLGLPDDASKEDTSKVDVSKEDNSKEDVSKEDPSKEDVCKDINDRTDEGEDNSNSATKEKDVGNGDEALNISKPVIKQKLNFKDDILKKFSDYETEEHKTKKVVTGKGNKKQKRIK